MPLREAVECIKRNKNFLITSHTNPEGDSLGSELSFYRLIKKLGKNAVIVNEDSVPSGYEFLPFKENIIKYKDTLRIAFDYFVTLDCSDLKRTGEVWRMNNRNLPCLNIDHHISNQYFGQANWVDPYASSCSEMIYNLYKKMRVSFDRDAAICLYTGMLVDTGSFRYSNTSSSTHKAIAELLRFKLDVPAIHKSIYENIPFQDMKLLAKILPGIKRRAQGKIVWFQIKKDLLRNKKLSFDLSEHILTYARAIKGVEVAALFKENLGVKDQIRVNLRSQGGVDVNKIAASFGGGGHKAASGITIHGKIEQVKRKVLAKIEERL